MTTPALSPAPLAIDLDNAPELFSQNDPVFQAIEVSMGKNGLTPTWHAFCHGYGGVMSMYHDPSLTPVGNARKIAVALVRARPSLAEFVQRFALVMARTDRGYAFTFVRRVGR